ncbi:MAG TPA: transglutaminaseTgpA domain-containing protein [Candidatus Omnitrophota bacterium]|nr:transglutaminaseTgpA domain-containing protein [Candidatus Omnitrophota bacterium]
MIKTYLNIFLLLFSSWTVYSQCQNETVLPYAIGAIIVFSLLMRVRTSDRQFAFFGRIPLSAIIIVSFIAGLLWRNIYPPPEDAVSPFPTFTAALQSGAIFASAIIWLKPFSMKNAHHLFFLAWLTVAVSSNVPFTDSMLFAFCAFCVIAVAVVILQTMNRPPEPKHRSRHYRDFIFFSILIVGLTTGLFYGISRSIVIMDEVFMRLIGDYVMPRSYTHFLSINRFMKLVPPGSSARDKRPVLEIKLPSDQGTYLKTQVFEDFDQGAWSEEEEIAKFPFPDKFTDKAQTAEMAMFVSFENIVPSPYGLAAAKSKMPLTKSDYGIIYAEDDQRTRIVEFALIPENASVELSSSQLKKCISLPADIASVLHEISSSIVESASDDSEKADRLNQYFLNHFQYSLDVDFRADHEGLIQMILEKRPAYCTYFATALALLLRSQDIPARVAAGFLVNEKIHARKNIFLARVYDAHAWVEVLLTDIDPKSGLSRKRWKVMDPTPAGERRETIRTIRIDLSKIAENIWLSILRLSVYLENLDKNKLKTDMLYVLIMIMLLINAKKIFAGIHRLLVTAKKQALPTSAKKDPVRLIYQRYEQYLKNAFREARKPSETDREVVDRLKTQPKIPSETIGKIESFIGQYHAARFGDRKNTALEKMIEDIEQKKRP